MLAHRCMLEQQDHAAGRSGSWQSQRRRTDCVGARLIGTSGGSACAGRLTEACVCAEEQAVDCPSGATIALSASSGFVSDDAYPSTVTCPDVAELCGAATHARGALTCANNASCSERGRCVDGVCRCNLLHTGPDCSRSIFAGSGAAELPAEVPPPTEPPPPRSPAPPPPSAPLPRQPPSVPGPQATQPPAPELPDSSTRPPPPAPSPPSPAPVVPPSDRQFVLRTVEWSECTALSSALLTCLVVYTTARAAARLACSGTAHPATRRHTRCVQVRHDAGRAAQVHWASAFEGSSATTCPRALTWTLPSVAWSTTWCLRHAPCASVGSRRAWTRSAWASGAHVARPAQACWPARCPYKTGAAPTLRLSCMHVTFHVFQVH